MSSATGSAAFPLHGVGSIARNMVYDGQTPDGLATNDWFWFNNTAYTASLTDSPTFIMILSTSFGGVQGIPTTVSISNSLGSLAGFVAPFPTTVSISNALDSQRAAVAALTTTLAIANSLGSQFDASSGLSSSPGLTDAVGAGAAFGSNFGVTVIHTGGIGSIADLLAGLADNDGLLDAISELFTPGVTGTAYTASVSEIVGLLESIGTPFAVRLAASLCLCVDLCVISTGHGETGAVSAAGSAVGDALTEAFTISCTVLPADAETLDAAGEAEDTTDDYIPPDTCPC